MHCDNLTTISHQTHLIDDLTGGELADFWSRITVDPEKGCWIWRASGQIAEIGEAYGRFTYRGKSEASHRISYAIFHHAIPRGTISRRVVDHLCAIKLCCNPAHLEYVTLSVNTQRCKQYTRRPMKYSGTRDNPLLYV